MCLYKESLWLLGERKLPLYTGRKLNVHKMLRRRPGRLRNVLCTFNLRPAPWGYRHFQSVTYQYKNVDSKSLDTLLVFGD